MIPVDRLVHFQQLVHLLQNGTIEFPTARQTAKEGLQQALVEGAANYVMASEVPARMLLAFGSVEEEARFEDKVRALVQHRSAQLATKRDFYAVYGGPRG